jgi:peptidoglycan hydrolase-like protein with peptidoglycan-binding domain
LIVFLNKGVMMLRFPQQRMWIVSLLISSFLVSCSAEPSQQPVLAPTAQPSATVVIEPSPTVQAQLPPTAEPATEVPPTTQPASEVPTAVQLSRTLLLQNPPLEGDDVAAVQQRLLDLGYSQVGVVDGIFGPQTERAVIAFQQANDLDADGIVGPLTGEKLFRSDAVAYAPLYPVVDTLTGFLLGSSGNGTWHEPQETVRHLAGGENYRLYSLMGQVGTATGALPETIGDGPCEDVFTIALTPEPSERTIALVSDWDAQPRTPVIVSASSEIETLVADWLVEQGIAQPEVEINQVVEIDLEDDGSVETLITATRYTATESFGVSANAGDYSAILLWNKDKGTLREVASELYPRASEFAAPNSFSLLALLDLDGDGVLEIVIESHYYEGGTTEVYTVADGTMRAALVVGCGA